MYISYLLSTDLQIASPSFFIHI